MLEGCKVILHVGMSLAGSTPVQDALFRAREILLQSGVLFPRTGFVPDDRIGRARASGHWELVELTRSGKPFLADASNEILEAEPHTLILSAEDIFHEANDADLASMAKTLSSARELHLVAVVRNQADWILSRYLDAVSSGHHRETSSLDAFIASESHLNYENRISYLKRVLQPTRVSMLSYDSIDADDLGHSLAAIVGLALPSVSRLGNPKRTVPIVEAIETQRRLNVAACLLSYDDYSEWSNALWREATRVGLTEGYPRPSSDTWEALRKCVEESNESLSQQYFGGQRFAPRRHWDEAKFELPSVTDVHRLIEFASRDLRRFIGAKGESDRREKLQLVDSLEKTSKEACAEEVEAQRKIKSGERSLKAMKTSTSWRLTAPLRILGNIGLVARREKQEKRGSQIVVLPVRNGEQDDVDVCIVTTLRFPGGNASSTLAEAKALMELGRSVRLIHVPVTAAGRNVSSRYNELMSICIHADDVKNIKTKVAIVRAPRVIISDDFAELSKKMEVGRGYLWLTTLLEG